MTVKQFSEVAAGRIYLNDFGNSFSAVPGSVLFDAIKDCKICEIESRGGGFRDYIRKTACAGMRKELAL